MVFGSLRFKFEDLGEIQTHIMKQQLQRSGDYRVFRWSRVFNFEMSPAITLIAKDYVDPSKNGQSYYVEFRVYTPPKVKFFLNLQNVTVSFWTRETLMV